MRWFFYPLAGVCTWQKFWRLLWQTRPMQACLKCPLQTRRTCAGMSCPTASRPRVMRDWCFVNYEADATFRIFRVKVRKPGRYQDLQGQIPRPGRLAQQQPQVARANRLIGRLAGRLLLAPGMTGTTPCCLWLRGHGRSAALLFLPIARRLAYWLIDWADSKVKCNTLDFSD